MKEINIRFGNQSKIPWIFKLIITAIAVIIAAHILPGVHVSDFLTAVWVAVIITLLNLIVRPIIIALTIPITVVSFGFFLLVINAFIILMTDWLVDSFTVDGFWYALLFSVILGLITWLLELPGKLQQKQQEQQKQQDNNDDNHFDSYEEVE